MRFLKTRLFIFPLIGLLAISCVGPVKELKYQIEDTWDVNESFADNPKPLKEIENLKELTALKVYSFDEDSKRNLNVALCENLYLYPSFKGYVYAFDLKSNKLLWTYNHKKNIISGLACDNKGIFFVDKNGDLISLSLTGNKNWISFVGEAFSLPSLTINSVLIRLSNNSIISLNLLDGSKNWVYQLPKSTLSLRSWPQISTSGDTIYVGGTSGKVIALDLNSGLLKWETTFSSIYGNSELERSNDVTSNIIVDNSALFVISSNGHIAALSLLDGSVLWTRALSSFVGMVSNTNNLFVTHNSGSIYSIAKNNNEVLWRNADLLGRDVSRPLIIGDILLVSDYEGYLHVLDLVYGKIISRYKISDNLILNPVIFEDRVILSALSGETYFIDNLIGSSSLNNFMKVEANETEDAVIAEDIVNEKEESIIDSIIFWD